MEAQQKFGTAISFHRNVKEAREGSLIQAKGKEHGEAKASHLSHKHKN